MSKYPVPLDDLLDVMEMTKKLETAIEEVISDNEFSLGVSSLMNASINTILGQCKTYEEILYWRNIFMKIFDQSIRSIKIKNED